MTEYADSGLKSALSQNWDVALYDAGSRIASGTSATTASVVNVKPAPTLPVTLAASLADLSNRPPTPAPFSFPPAPSAPPVAVPFPAAPLTGPSSSSSTNLPFLKLHHTTRAPSAAQGPPAVKPEPFYRNTYFQHGVAVTAVFLVCFILLIAIRPPFTYRPARKQKTADGREIVTSPAQFSGGRAALIALGVTCLAGIVMFITAMVLKQKQGIRFTL